MSKIDDGGYVYPPLVYFKENGEHKPVNGITRRDWLAGLAMQALATNPDNWRHEDIPKLSYQLADALIAEGRKEG